MLPDRCLSVCLSCLSVCNVGVLWPNGYMDQDETWRGGRPRPWPGHIASDRDQASPPPKGHSPQLSVQVCCGQTAGWIKMPLGMEVGLGPGHIVLDEDPVPSPKRDTAPTFRPVSRWPNGRPSQLLLSTCKTCQRCHLLVI